jgi:glycosyltransferase involved in cell wall biosynthesis
MDVSVIICCYNSENRIVPTLEHLSKQILGHLNCEIILVDNNCKDQTVAIAEEFWSKLRLPISLRIIKEERAGIAFARNAGVLNSKGEIILFCDDDNWLEENYIMYGYNIMKNDKSIGVLGGRSNAIFEDTEPFWFTTYQSSYAVGVQALNSGEINSRGYVWGAGSFMRKDTLLLFYEFGFKHFCSGRKGNVLLAGDDSEICKWHLLIGKNLWYDEHLLFNHFVESRRLKKSYLEGITQGFVESHRYLSVYDNLISYNKSNFLQKIKMEIYGILKLLNSYKTEREKRLIKHQIKKVLKNFDSKRIV